MKPRARLVLSLTISMLLIGAPMIASGRPATDPRAAGEDRQRLLDETVGRDWFRSDDLAIAATGDQRGMHFYSALARHGFGWRALASIAPGGMTVDDWIGSWCLTGDGRFVIATVAPRSFNNSATLRDRGAFAYVISAQDGTVRPLARGIALTYHTPGCGLGSTATLIRNLGFDQERTQLLFVDAERAVVRWTSTVRGQLTSAVPVGSNIVAAMGSMIVRVAPRATRPSGMGSVTGQPFSFRPEAGGGVDLLVRDADRIDVVRMAGARPSILASGPVSATTLTLGRGGRNVLLGADRIAVPGALRTARVPRGRVAAGTSLDGRAVLSHPSKAESMRGAKSAARMAHGGVVPDGARSIRVSGASNGASLSEELPDATAPAFTGVPSVTQSRTASAQVVAANTTTPTCSVPRNDLRRQVLQPTRQRVDWAVQAAVRKLLQGANARPANYANMGLAAYSPSLDFTIPALLNGSKQATATPIPPSVMNGILAQESAYRQASFHALPGVAGNPAISDYYGNGGNNVDSIDYDQADCGYGIAQVTTGMRNSETIYTANGKAKIAVDYAENIVVGAKILAEKWNQLINAGIIANGGDPNRLENWYFAIWAYNSGVNPQASTGNTTGCTPGPACTDSAGNWGMGWTNNPMNPNYPPNRSGFLRATYADAEHPQDWPYQEKVFGWMETPILNYKGEASYGEPLYQYPKEQLTIPGYKTFCTLVDNKCNPNPPAGTYPCTYSQSGSLQYHCWWHKAVTFENCPSACATSFFTYSTTATEPTTSNPHPPACSSTLPANAIVVDEQPAPGYNLVGCGSTSSTGTFTYTVGSNAAGAPLGIIDFHQLGVGFGGHIWYTHNRAASDTAHLVTGTWTKSLTTGVYVVHAHVPDTGANTGSAHYKITTSSGSVIDRAIDQHLHANRWVTLGAHTLGSNARVTLSNVTDDPGRHNVGYDAVAFVPVTGTVVTKVIDAASIFSEDQNLDTQTPSQIDTPFRTRQTLYDWAKKFSFGAGTYKGGSSYPACVVVKNTTCVGTNSRTAFANWWSDVQAAGTHPTQHPAGKSIPRWLGFANNDPRSGVTASGAAAYFANHTTYKIRTRATVTFVRNTGAIVPGSGGVYIEQRAGDTEMPKFMKDIFSAYKADYNVTAPTVTYDSIDLRAYTHESTHVVGFPSGLLPGREYRPHLMDPQLVENNTCVAIKAIGGGTIGYRPMLAQPSATNDVLRWWNDAKQLVTSGKAPAVIRDTAAEIYNAFYRPGQVGSLFNHAGPIWTLLNFRVCQDGTIKPDPTLTKVMHSGYMPDIYLWNGSVGMSLSGGASTTRVHAGDYINFTNNPLTAPSGNAFGPCHIAGRGEGGNPWNIYITDAADTKPTSTHYCDPSEQVDAPPDQSF